MKHQLDGAWCSECGAVWFGRYPRQDDDDCPGKSSEERRDRLARAVDDVMESTLARGRHTGNVDWSLVAYEVSKIVGKPCGLIIHGAGVYAYELPIADETL